MKRKGKKVGTWPLLGTYVELRYDHALRGGEFYNWPADTGVPYIVVGGYGGEESWGTLAGTLTHEIMEYAMAHRGLRFYPSPELVSSHAGYVFHMNHEQFSEVASECGCFISLSLPVIHRVFLEANKRKNKTKTN